MATNWQPTERNGDYTRWDLPAHVWSGADFQDETIKITRNGDEWYGVTEVDQCVHRDLDDGEIASVREEFDLR